MAYYIKRHFQKCFQNSFKGNLFTSLKVIYSPKARNHGNKSRNFTLQQFNGAFPREQTLRKAPRHIFPEAF